jgi:hypothetical protein
MVVDPDDALFIEYERCVQFASVLERGGQYTNWHLVAARRADKLRPPRPRVEHGDALDRIMQACTERGKIIAEQLADVADARRRKLRLRRDDAPMDVIDQSNPQRGGGFSAA